MASQQTQLPQFVPEWAKQMVLGAAQKYNIPAAVLASLLQQESGYRINAVSSAGAQGIAQFMPGTAQGMHIDPMNPAQAIDGAAHYLRNAMDHFGGSVPLALAAYNAGSGAVQRFGGIPPYPETQNYVRNIMSMSGMSGAQPAMPQQQQPQQGPPPQGQGAIPPTQINNPSGQSPMPQMGRQSPGGAQGGGQPAEMQPRTNPYSSTPWNMSQYHGGLQLMMNNPATQPGSLGLPTTAFNPAKQQGQAQQAPISLDQIIAQGNANVPSVSSPSTPTATPSSILPFLTGGNA